MATENLLNDKKILIVDDDLDLLETLEDLLDMCRIEKASDFDQARKLLVNQDFDMVILDIMGVDGYKLLEIAHNKGVPAVMLTAHALSPGDAVKSFKNGADSYVPKDKIAEITTFLSDVLEAKAQGKHPWWRWLERFGDFFARRFGADWQKRDDAFWENIARFGPY
ncbi:response regulator [Thermodesulfobacteriota bacterium]